MRMTAASSPGKFILMGEHAVVFGEPAIALAMDLRLRCKVSRSSVNKVNGQPLGNAQHSYIGEAIKQSWGNEPVSVEIASEIPSGSGLGSSAAVTVSTIAALLEMKGEFSPESVARTGFEVESAVQGRASPIDTSTCSHGNGVFINREKGERFLWKIEKDTRRWFIHDLKVPRMSFVVGFTGSKGPTGPLVAKVKRYYDKTTFARDIIKEIGQLTTEGMDLLKKDDRVQLGEAMTRNHKLLAILGVSTPMLDKLIDATLPYSYGAKLTGAGGGGSMIALTDRVDEVCAAIRSRGGIPYAVHTGVDGVRIE